MIKLKPTPELENWYQFTKKYSKAITRIDSSPVHRGELQILKAIEKWKKENPENV